MRGGLPTKAEQAKVIVNQARENFLRLGADDPFVERVIKEATECGIRGNERFIILADALIVEKMALEAENVRLRLPWFIRIFTRRAR